MEAGQALSRVFVNRFRNRPDDRRCHGPSLEFQPKCKQVIGFERLGTLLPVPEAGHQQWLQQELRKLSPDAEVSDCFFRRCRRRKQVKGKGVQLPGGGVGFWVLQELPCCGRPTSEMQSISVWLQQARG